MDHDLVLFTDDDTIPPLDWAENSFDGSKIQKSVLLATDFAQMRILSEQNAQMLLFARNS